MLKTICVIDDDSGVRETLGAWLEDYGYGVISADSGDEAFEFIRRNQPHLIILDIIMPDIDGLEVLSQLKSSPETRAIPVIMLTAKKDLTTIAKAQELEAVEYFMKPFDNNEFLAAITRHLDRV